MAFFLSPVLNEQQFDANGDPRAGALISTYLAGTLTAATVYKTSTGTAHTNPIQLDSSGNYPNGTQLWLLGGFAYKFVITDSNGANSRTYDNITGVGDDLSGIDQWVVFAAAPTYISATSFSLTGDQTNIFQINRRIRTVNGGGTVYSSITNSAFAAGITTVTVVNDSGVLDASISQVSYGLLSVTNDAIPRSVGMPFIGTPVATTTGTFKDFTVFPWTSEIDIPLTNVSTTGTSPLMIQLGDSGGIEASSYSGTTIEVIGATAANYSTGFAVGVTISAAAAFFGSLILRRANAAGTSWTIMGMISQGSTGQTYLCSGQKLLSAQLTTVRLTTVSGVPTLDTGEANIIQR